MGANLALARRKTKLAAAVVQLYGLRFSFHLAYDRPVFNGLLFIWGTFKSEGRPWI
jgi:hypothetical protein